eukprot:TRINITY_DN93327_c0_g1_i1.p1 TRINITY_DN93327_c0_g1~~TRINITY_DN93327_c0_g1_i1.p1  ORF type:complete len:175 (-),score=51.48 TRINITY_DN93327_c0_g1_i1:253-777(-)
MSSRADGPKLQGGSWLTEDQVEELDMAFRLLDRTGEGSVTDKEIGAVMNALGRKATNEEIKFMISEVDEDSSNDIQFPEFLNFMAAKLQDDSLEEEMGEAFNTLSDGRSKITADSLQNLMAMFGERASKEEALEMIKEADVDGDGVISYEDFVDFVTQKGLKPDDKKDQKRESL